MLGRALQAVEYACFRLALAVLGRVPRGWVERSGGILGGVAALLLPRARRTARRNLRASGLPHPEETVRAVFRHFAVAAIETARLARALDRQGPAALAGWSEVAGLDELRRALDTGRGAILAVPHLGNWELLGLTLAVRGFPLDAVARSLDNPRLDCWVRAFRAQTGQRLLEKKGALRAAVQTLRAGRLLAVLPDQYAGSTGTPARCFGRPVAAPGIVAALAARFSAPVFFATCVRVGPQEYRIRCARLPGPPEQITAQVFAAIEEAVRAAPAQWLWMHDLWRTPGAGPDAEKKKPRSLYRRVKRALKDAGLWPHVQLVQYLAFRALVAFLQALPAEALPRCARGLAALLPLVCRRERRVFERNADLVFGPGFAPAARRRALRRVFESFVLMAHDAFAFPRRVRRAHLDRHFATVGREHVDAALARGRGVIFVLGHLGNWELASLHMAALGYPMTGIFAERTNPRIDEYLTRWRTSTGAELLLREGALKRAIRALQANRALSLVIDLDAGESGVFVDFFGRPAATMLTAVSLARRTGAPLIPFASERIGPLRYRNVFHPPIDAAGAPATPAEDQRLLQEATAVLEAAIRRRPEQWAWMNDRWKTRPPGAGSA